MYESDDKMVSHPDHYKAGGIEVIDVIEAFTKNLVGIEATDTGNVIKYILRWKKKNGVQDLEKALWYLTHLIERVKMHEEEKRKLTSNAGGDYVSWTTTIPMPDDVDRP